MVGAIVSIGPALINLGPNTATAAKRLGKIFGTRETQLEFLRLGINPDRLLEIQSEAIKYLSGYGAPLSNDDTKIKKATLEYTKTLNVLSSLTGENRDETAKKLADLKMDVSYQIQKTQMMQAGREKEAKEMDKSLVVLNTIRPEISKGFSDFLANGQATTEDGKAMMFITRGRARTIAADIKAGRITGIEGSKQLMKYYEEFMKNQKTNLSISDEYAEKTRINGNVLAKVDQLLKTKSEKDVEDMIKEQSKIEDKAKNLQNEQIELERVAAKTKNALTEMVSGLATTVFKTLLGFVKSLAYSAAGLGNWLAKGELKEAFEDIQILLGNQDQLKKKHDDISDNLKKTRLDIGALERSEGRIAKQEKDIDIIEKAAKASPKDAALQQTLKAAKKRLEEEKQTKETLFGKNAMSDLILRRDTLLKKEQAISGQILGYENEDRQAETQKRMQKKLEMVEQSKYVDLSDASKYIQFGSGSGSMENWGALTKKNTSLTQQFTLLAKEYYTIKKEKLMLASSYRSPEEQQALYDGWVKAGGNKQTRPTVYVPGHGNVSTPANPQNGEKLGPHTRGIAFDVSIAQLEFMEKNGILEKFGFRRPYKEKDPVHIEPFRQGGIVSGSNMIEMHGREALIEMRNGTIPIDMSSMTQGIKSKNTQPVVTTQTDDTEIDLGLLSMIDSQFDDLITSIEKSNIIQYDIKTYMAA